MACLPKREEGGGTCVDHAAEDDCDKDKDCFWASDKALAVSIVVVVVIFLLYLVLIFFLSRWISSRLDVQTPVVFAVGVFLPPVWIVFLVMAIVKKDETRAVGDSHHHAKKKVLLEKKR